ncbi:DEAD/DEAH box helicase [Xylocopilactobacillus apis]|uniref:ATP-dependent RNA helicase CshA n=1 Tax=Xylocopilactobacillus apis TaxID=2932183 RepID=A0AAU9DDK6_9LACO|nr:DEAD/DEAH box helicase [Xylocopilactobacillus apis]BDR56236.1 DEAD-box ATP-dependent RNA helicase CshA [Xylocopilactobacillus apis]
MKFNELDLQPEVLKAIKDAGYVEMTPIQEQSLPLVLEKKDVLGQAQTGTGKTAAFGIPAIQEASHEDHFISTLVMSPTRELAIQTRDELAKLGHDKKIRVMVVYGGADIGRQIKDLKNPPQILVGTPGRLQDHINRKNVDFSHLKTLVLDEADEMLDMGFLEDISKIIRSLPKERQTLLFSATMPQDIMQIGTAFMKNPVTIKVKSKELTADLIDQYYVKARDNEKFDFMTRLMDVQRPELALVFGRTKRRVDELTRGLKIRGFKAEGIHGDLTQQKRMNVLRMFKAGEIQILVATDVAARGLDIRGVTHVYNYDIPQDPDSYVHRIGRTGRAGRAGMSITFVNPREMDYLRGIERLTKVKMIPLMPPTADKVQKELINYAMSQIESKSSSINVSKYKEEAEKLVSEIDPLILASLLLQSYTKSSTKNRPVNISVERPLPLKKKSGNGHQRNNRGNSRHYNSRSSYHHDRDRDQKKFGHRDYKKKTNTKKEPVQKKVNRNFVIRTNA